MSILIAKTSKVMFTRKFLNEMQFMYIYTPYARPYAESWGYKTNNSITFGNILMIFIMLVNSRAHDDAEMMDHGEIS